MKSRSAARSRNNANSEASNFQVGGTVMWWVFLLPFALVTAIYTVTDVYAKQPPALLLGESSSQIGQGMYIRPIDPGTLADLPGYTPLALKNYAGHAFSPDGQLLAAIVQSDEVLTNLDPDYGIRSESELHLIDLTSWTETINGVKVASLASGLTFGPEGQTLYWFQPTTFKTYHGSGTYSLYGDYVLHRYDIATGEMRTMTEFPVLFDPWSSRTLLLPEDNHLAVYGILRDSADPVRPALPYLYVIDLNTGDIIYDIALDGVELFEDTEPFHQRYHPGWDWDRVGRRLYLVHATADRVTVADLIQGKILQQAEVRPRFSLLDYLWHWLVTPAVAKFESGISRYAVLSLDRMRLYVVGLRREQDRETSLGLQVIATEDLAEMVHLDLPVNYVSLSPDGRWLLLPGQAGSGGLYILDAQQIEQRAHLQPGTVFWVQGFSSDSHYAYISYSDNSESGFKVVDLILQDLVAERLIVGSSILMLNTRTLSSSVSVATAITDEAGSTRLPTNFALAQNYPNPFNAQTTITYQLPHTTWVRLTLYNVAGQPVKHLVDRVGGAGEYQVFWNGTDDTGRAVGGGIYFYRLETEKYHQTRRLILLK